jgi:Zn-dependent peptidase ImmA (M78 family)
MTKLPKTFTYMHHKYKIYDNGVLKFEDTGKEMLGMVKWRDSVIRVDANMDRQQVIQTLAHEVWHIAVDRSGLPLDADSTETFVDTIAYAMIEMFRSNPKWFGKFWLNGDADAN